jgi:hypothetical protein
MQEILAEKQEKDSMIIRKASLLIITLMMGYFWSACSGDNDGLYAEIPDGPVSLTINLDLPLYFHMHTMGSFSYHQGGHKGVLLIHNFDDEFYAFERTCTHQPDLSCSRVEVDSLLINIRCGAYVNNVWEECCDSKFFFDGQLERGPARLPLKQFPVIRNGSVLSIRN